MLSRSSGQIHCNRLRRSLVRIKNSLCGSELQHSLFLSFPRDSEWQCFQYRVERVSLLVSRVRDFARRNPKSAIRDALVEAAYRRMSDQRAIPLENATTSNRNRDRSAALRCTHTHTHLRGEIRPGEDAGARTLALQLHCSLSAGGDQLGSRSSRGLFLVVVCPENNVTVEDGAREVNACGAVRLRLALPPGFAFGVWRRGVHFDARLIDLSIRGDFSPGDN